jgi:hypothetical protein
MAPLGSRCEAPEGARRGVLPLKARVGEAREAAEKETQADRTVGAQGASAGHDESGGQRMLGGEGEQGRGAQGLDAVLALPCGLDAGESSGGRGIGDLTGDGGDPRLLLGVQEDEAIGGVPEFLRSGYDISHPSLIARVTAPLGRKATGEGATSAGH